MEETEEYASCLSSCQDEEENDSQWNEPDDHLDDVYIGMSALDMLINNKSSKKIYKAVAKELGIACQMSEQCRCDDCQGNYFNSEYNLEYYEVYGNKLSYWDSQKSLSFSAMFKKPISDHSLSFM